MAITRVETVKRIFVDADPTSTAIPGVAMPGDRVNHAGTNYVVTAAGVVTEASQDATPSFESVSVASTITSATPATTRLTQSEVTLTPATTVAIAAGGSIAGVRGGITLTAAKTFTEGFLYGAQGKVTLNGTMNEGSAARIAGALGQVDLAAGTLTDGQVSCLWADLQGGTGTLTDQSQLNLLRLTNSSSATPNAVIMTYGEATYFLTSAKDGGTPAYFADTVPQTLSGSLKVKIGATDFFIGLYETAAP